MIKLKELIKESDNDKIWIVSKDSGSAYQVTRKTYEKNKNWYILAGDEGRVKIFAKAYNAHKRYRKKGGTADFDLKKWVGKVNAGVKESREDMPQPKFNALAPKYVNDVAKMIGTAKGTPEYQWVLREMFIEVLEDVNFRPEASKARRIFNQVNAPHTTSRAEADKILGKITNYALDLSQKAKWNGYTIIKGFAEVAGVGVSPGHKAKVLKMIDEF